MKTQLLHSESSLVSIGLLLGWLGINAVLILGAWYIAHSLIIN